MNKFQNIEIETKAWKSTYINLPKRPEFILQKLYGSTWQTPIQYTHEDKIQKSKGDTIYNTSFKSII